MLAKQGTKNIPILMYHSISKSGNPRFKDLCVPPALFAAQVDYLYHHAYTFLNVTQLIHALTGKVPLPERPVVLTFDDGFADFYIHALPILSCYNITATLYITTGFVESTSGWLRRERETKQPMLTWSEITEISDSGIECGAHTHSHPKLDTLPLAIARNEILRSKDLLEQHLGQEVTSFAYPFGHYTSDIRRLVKQAGFTSACAVNFAMCSATANHFTLERLMVTPNMDINTFQSLFIQSKPSKLRRVKYIYTRARIPVKRMLRHGMASIARYHAEILDSCYEGVR